MFSKVEQPGFGTTLSPATPLNFETGRLNAEPAPVLGQHTESVLLDQLNLSSSELGRLVDAGLVMIGKRPVIPLSL